MIDYSNYLYQDSVFNMYHGISYFNSWSVTDAGGGGGFVGKYRALLGIGI